MLPVCVCEGPVNQPPIETIAHSTGVWLSSLCCQLFGCIVLVACLNSRLCQWMPSSHRTHIYTYTHAQNCTYTNICCATVKTAPAAPHDSVVGGGELSACLFVHLEVVCFVKHHSVTAGGDGGFGHVKRTASAERATLLTGVVESVFYLIILITVIYSGALTALQKIQLLNIWHQNHKLLSVYQVFMWRIHLI